MSTFNFKVPPVPEQTSALKRMKGNTTLKPYNFTENSHGRNVGHKNSINSNAFSQWRNRNTLLPINDVNRTDEMEASTSQNKSGTVVRSTNMRFPAVLYDRPRCQMLPDVNNRARQTDFRHALIENNFNSSQSDFNFQNLSNSSFGPRLFKNNINVNSTNNCLSLSNSSTMRDSLHMNQSKMINQLHYSDLQRQRVVSRELTCSSNRSSIFGTKFLPQKNIYERENSMINATATSISNINAYNTHFNTDVSLPFNENTNVTDNSKLMKSCLSSSYVSLKEQVLNSLESLGHMLLSNSGASENGLLQLAINKTVKDVKQIFQNSIMNLTAVNSTTEMQSTLNYISHTICDSQRRTVGFKEQMKTDLTMPDDILRNLSSQSQALKCPSKIKYIESFTIDKMSSPPDESHMVKNDISSVLQKTENSEINLTNWYPAVVGDELAFIGTNDEGVVCKTEVMTKRVNSGRVYLKNKLYCNLIGKPSGSEVPKELMSKFKHGFPARWRALVTEITNSQRESPEKEDSQDYNMDVYRKLDSETPVKVTSKSAMCNTPKRMQYSRKAKRSIKIGNENSDGNSGVIMAKSKPKVVQAGNSDGKISAKGEEIKKVDAAISKRGTPERKSIIVESKSSGSDIHKVDDVQINTVSRSETRTKSEPSKNVKEKTTIPLKRKLENVDCSSSEKKSKTKPQEQVAVSRMGNVIKTTTVKKKKKSPAKKTQKSISPQKATKEKGKSKKKVNENIKQNVLPWENEVGEGLDDIMIPEISSHTEECKLDKMKLKMLGAETPPLEIFRSNLKILKNCTPLQSPSWQVSQRTRSEVKKFEKLRAQTFKRKIPLENAKRSGRKEKRGCQNKDVNTVIDWISEKDVNSPKKCSRIVKYIIPQRRGLEIDENEMECSRDLDC